MSSIRMRAKTVRLSETLIQQIEQMAAVSRRSFTKQTEVMLENSIDHTVESDLELLRQQGVVMPSQKSATTEN